MMMVKYHPAIKDESWLEHVVIDTLVVICLQVQEQEVEGRL